MPVTAWTLGGTAASGGTGIAWSTPSNCLTDGTDDALSNINNNITAELRVTNFNFSSLIAAGAIIDGIEVRTKVYHTNTAADIFDHTVSLFSAGAMVGSNKALAAEWPVFTGGSASVTTRDYGGAADKWGLTPSYSDVTNSGFGVAIKAYETASVSNGARVQAVWIRVHYHYSYSADGDVSLAAQLADGIGSIIRKAIADLTLPATLADGSASNVSGSSTITAVGEVTLGVMTSDGNAVFNTVFYVEASLVFPGMQANGLVDYEEYVPVVPEIQEDTGPAQILKAYLQAQPSIGAKLRPYTFASGVVKPAVFLERMPYNAKNPCIVITPHGGSPELGTRSSRSFTEYLEVEIRFNINSSSGVLKHLGDTAWKLLERHIELVQGGKYWFSSERPELTQDNNSLICTLDVKANYMENI